MIIPAPLIARRRIINKLLNKNAVSRESAVTFEEAGISNHFQAVASRLIKQGILRQCGDNYYLDTTTL